MWRRIKIAYHQSWIDGIPAALKFLFTGRGLADWEQELLAARRES